MPRRSAYKIAVAYALIAAVWILFSDRLLTLLAGDSSALTRLQTLKGWLFVLVTSLLLYLLVRRQLRQYERSERALHETETRFQELVENATYGIFRSTVNGVFLDVNTALVKMLGYGSKEELVNKRLFQDIFVQFPDDAFVPQQNLPGSRIERKETQWKRKDGTSITVLLSGRVYRRKSDGATIFEGIVEDITERRALETRGRQLQQFEAIGQLAGGIAHDFNNMLGAIMGWTQLALDRTSQDERLRSHLEKAYDQAERGANLTRQLLAFARRQILEPRNVDVNRVVSETLSLMRTTIGSHIDIKMVLAADMDVARVDPSQLEQVFMNLCLNARDAMPKGGQLLIETRTVELDEEYCRRYAYASPGRYALLAVSDTGTGMDKATIGRIFEPFFTTKEKGKGTGLGLATVYGIVKQHGGLIHAYSEIGRGSVFRVYLPVGSGRAEVRKRSLEEEVRGGKETILIAEDHAATREMTQQALESLGYTVLAATNGQEAVHEFSVRCNGIALVLLDVVMPKLTGPEAFKKMCSIKSDVPVLFATGYSTESELLKAVADRDHPIIQKPYTIRSLARRVREVIDASAVHASR